MGQVTIKRVTNANLYLDGNSLLGKAEEVSLPEVKFKMSEHNGLGMIGDVELPSGIEKMEAKVKWNSFYEDVLLKVSNPFKPLSFQVRASRETYGSAGRSAEEPIVAYITGQPKSFPAGNFKKHDNVEAESTFTVTYYKLVVNSVEIVEIDVMSNIFKINGVDQLATYRANIGG